MAVARTTDHRAEGKWAQRGLWVVPATAALAAGSTFLARGAAIYPMDDAHIHFQYARVLAATGRLEFNPGERLGIGTTSPLWVWVLALGESASAPSVVLARVLGLASLVTCATLVALLARPTLSGSPTGGHWPAAMLGALVGVSGNVVWFSLSGVETTAFLAAGLGAFWSYGRGRWLGAATCAACAALLRPGGLAVPLVLAGLEAWRARGTRALRPAVWGAIAASVLPVVAWLLYVHQRTGQWLPTTLAGKAVYHADIMRYFMASHPALALFTGSRQVMYFVLWGIYVLLYVFGGATLPGPGFTVAGDVGESVGIRCSWVGLAVGVLLMLPLVGLGARRLIAWLRGSLRPLDPGALGVWLWAGLHNIAYLIVLPGPGTATRYQAINHVMIWWLIVLGIQGLARGKRTAAAAVLLTCCVAASGAAYWRSVYAANLDHMTRAPIAAARLISATLGREENVAAYDIGALRYYGDHDVVDLGGLTDAAFPAYQRAGRVPDYMRDRGASYVVLPGRHSGDSTDLFSFAAYLGLDRTPLFDLEPLAVFETDRAVWARGEQATGNYQPSVRAYYVRWRQAPQ